MGAGQPIAYANLDPHTRTIWSCIDHGHWEQKLHRSNGGGRSWENLTDGLPQRNGHDITFRHALDSQYDRIVFGTTTGNVYASEDGGDQWYTVGNNFPPVYSVRFAEMR